MYQKVPKLKLDTIRKGGEPPSQKSVKSGHPGSGHTGGVAIGEGVVNFDLMNSVSQHMYCLYKCWKCLWTHFWGVFLFFVGWGWGGTIMSEASNCVSNNCLTMIQANKRLKRTLILIGQ